MSAPESHSHFTYGTLYDRLTNELEPDDARRALRIVRYALEMEALTRRREGTQIAREILRLADALADEPGSPRLAAAYDALAGEQS